MDDRLKKQLEFIVELDKAKRIVRQTYLADGSRKENDAEHSWHLAVMCMLLAEYSQTKINAAHTMLMLLIHDVIEIDAGDTYAYDSRANETKHKREETAADRIFALLPKDQEEYLRKLWEEFEQCETPEAKFARSMDNLQPLLQNEASGGKSWREHQVTQQQVRQRNRQTGESAAVFGELAELLIKKNVEAGNLSGNGE